ncbi:MULTISPECIES: flavin reductase family protein [unclassified Colwellia]|jgi:flavin reductase (DIM6/NTAB) family NADH-FMN oxidoreductase RutF|uniref:flavin reductase family protein n=1 Tax=unclassified Colwellia TaxID=196834 RepID=UPI0015F4F527|nr:MULTISPECIES: flavin reductase [unclassified Colwellia]MBA6250636.1 flavin reductase [Colwellia sp. MB3u-55]MBA6398047.1 flavin reductase [Colwellia sp. BRX10-4]
MKHLSHNELLKMDSRYRAQLINSLSGFKSANVIGTRNKQNHNNLAIFSSVVHLGSSPALVGFITRPDIVERHTLENILQTKQFTINQVNESFWQAAHQTSARYNADQSEFEQTDLTPYNVDGINAPFVKESHLKYALNLREIVPIELNGTQLVIGEITDILCDEIAIKADGYIDIESLGTVAISGLDSYHTSQRLSRLSYAKPEVQPREISLDGQALDSNSFEI